MKQYEAVVQVMEENGGFATLGFLYQHALKVPGLQWKTKTPFASIRRIVQDERFFYKIRAGLWALKAWRERLPSEMRSSRERSAEQQGVYPFVLSGACCGNRESEAFQNVHSGAGQEQNVLRKAKAQQSCFAFRDSLFHVSRYSQTCADNRCRLVQ